jgi:hypothetical protein
MVFGFGVTTSPPDTSDSEGAPRRVPDPGDKDPGCTERWAPSDVKGSVVAVHGSKAASLEIQESTSWVSPTTLRVFLMPFGGERRSPGTWLGHSFPTGTAHPVAP